MTVPQFGIFAQGTIAHEFIEFDLRADVEMGRATAALSQLRAPAVSAGGINLVIGFGAVMLTYLGGNLFFGGLHSYSGL